MGKKLKFTLLFLSLLIIFPLTVSAGLLDNYDFTYYKTISHSLSIANTSTIGIDYTGFGFLGEKDKEGLFLRIGFQVPYMKILDTLIKAFENRNKPQNITTLPGEEFNPATQTMNLDHETSHVDPIEDETLTNRERDFTFTFILGPAYRIKMNSTISLYSGVGFRLSEKLHINTALLENITKTTQNVSIGADFDIGARLSINNNTSVRYGVYGSYDIISFTYYKEEYKDDEKTEKLTSQTSNTHFNLLAPYGEHIPVNIIGYVSLGRVIKSDKVFKEYKYIITSREFNKGEIIILEDIE